MADVKLLTEEQAASVAGVHPRTIRRLIDKGLLPASNYGLGRKKLYRIDPAALTNVQPAQPPAPRERRRRRVRVEATAGLVWPPPKGWQG